MAINKYTVWIADNNSWSKVDQKGADEYAFAFLRKNFESLKKQKLKDDLKKTGVYILRGIKNNKVSDIYVGEANDLQQRWLSHKHFNSLWCYDVIVMTSKDNYTKNDLVYIEKKILGMLKEKIKDKNVLFHNGNSGNTYKLDDWRKDELNNEIENFYYLVKKIDLDFWNKNKLSNESSKIVKSSIAKPESLTTKSYETKNIPKKIPVYIKFKKRNAKGYGRYVWDNHLHKGKIIITKNSRFTFQFTDCMYKPQRSLERKRIANDRNKLEIKRIGDTGRFVSNSEPYNLSRACSIFNGTTCSGWDQWKVKDNDLSLNKYLKRK